MKLLIILLSLCLINCAKAPNVENLVDRDGEIDPTLECDNTISMPKCLSDGSKCVNKCGFASYPIICEYQVREVEEWQMREVFLFAYRPDFSGFMAIIYDEQLCDNLKNTRSQVINDWNFNNPEDQI